MARTVRMSISLDAIEDAQLIEYLDKYSSRGRMSAVIRKALYFYIDSGKDPDENGNGADVQALNEKLDGIHSVVTDLSDAVNSIRRELSKIKQEERQPGPEPKEGQPIDVTDEILSAISKIGKPPTKKN